MAEGGSGAARRAGGRARSSLGRACGSQRPGPASLPRAQEGAKAALLFSWRTCLNVSAARGRARAPGHAWVSGCLCVPRQHGREGHGHVLGGSKRLLGWQEGVLRPAHHAAPRAARRACRASAVAPPGAAPGRPRGALAVAVGLGPPARGRAHQVSGARPAVARARARGPGAGGPRSRMLSPPRSRAFAFGVLHPAGTQRGIPRIPSTHTPPTPPGIVGWSFPMMSG